MFTGIIETVGRIETIRTEGSNRVFTVASSISDELKIDQSVSHNGVCLTVTKVHAGRHEVVAIDETLSKTNLGLLTPSAVFNLERCMPANGRFDGHIVQGHVDQTARCSKVTVLNGSWLYDFEYQPAHGHVTVEKGSICVNGVSLTCFNSRDGAFRVAIIPYTFEHTNFHDLKENDIVNLEFDIIGKYIARIAAASFTKQ